MLKGQIEDYLSPYLLLLHILTPFTPSSNMLGFQLLNSSSHLLNHTSELSGIFLLISSTNMAQMYLHKAIFTPFGCSGWTHHILGQLLANSSTPIQLCSFSHKLWHFLVHLASLDLQSCIFHTFRIRDNPSPAVVRRNGVGITDTRVNI